MLSRGTKLIVVRHGESDANHHNIISDKLVDHPLTERGLKQAAETAEVLKDDQIDVVVSSTRQRALQTAWAINAYHNAKITLSDALVERDYGIFSGVDKSEAHATMASGGFNWLNIPESETAAQLDFRVQGVVAMVQKDHAGKCVLISTHEDVIRAFFRVIGGKSEAQSMSLRVENSHPYIFNCTR